MPEKLKLPPTLILSEELDRKHVRNPSLPAAKIATEGPVDRSENLIIPWRNIVKGTRCVARHSRLFLQNHRLDSLYVIRYGQFKLTEHGSNGRQRVVGFHMAGDWLGLDAIATKHHHFGAMAIEDSEVWEIPFSFVVDFINNRPKMQQLILALMSDALADKHEVSKFNGTSLDSRFARFLLTLGEKYARIGTSRHSYRLSMSRGDIASYLGTASENVSRAIARFQRSGLVTIIGKNVELIDCVALDALVNGKHRSIRNTVLH